MTRAIQRGVGEIAADAALGGGRPSRVSSGAPAAPAAPALQLTDVSKRWGKVDVLRSVSLSVAAGERHAVIGPNGAGKSTLFHVISGLTSPTRGRIQLDGRDIGGLAPHVINRRGLSRSFQVTNVFPRLTVIDNLRCAASWSLGAGYAFWRRASTQRPINDRADHLADRLGLHADRLRLAGELTYAQQRALELGMAIATDARVLLLDEPTAGMNRAEAARMVELVRGAAAGRSLLIIEHDMDVVFALADRLSVLVQGEVIASGAPDVVRQDPAVRAAYLGQARDGDGGTVSSLHGKGPAA
ncbi:ABC transporter ATP-binding protein [Pigmentiphaga litoralis]|uniref:Branched-chain amino acid transport system ATP-binding protein n=1 Tax=Pigmentiphaga litoralis TaxID=516702 RepID=A0A7Y9IWU8_9BURK|nr:ABC transporter ATP-binding protein [Pigmentiphaga litoralis]NYE21869.1 branched-chain amino acid transport system ATP-binding protein [Pigmentiphaga litoralis]NYE84516.1 branched-chain amino acid transport system ATP-binding protein [Pigmentiphaga litoralis]